MSLLSVSDWELVADVSSSQGPECFGVSLRSWEGMVGVVGRGEQASDLFCPEQGAKHQGMAEVWDAWELMEGGHGR